MTTQRENEEFTKEQVEERKLIEKCFFESIPWETFDKLHPDMKDLAWATFAVGFSYGRKNSKTSPMTVEQMIEVMRGLCNDETNAKSLVDFSIEEYRAIEKFHGIV